MPINVVSTSLGWCISRAVASYFGRSQVPEAVELPELNDEQRRAAYEDMNGNSIILAGICVQYEHRASISNMLSKQIFNY